MSNFEELLLVQNIQISIERESLGSRIFPFHLKYMRLAQNRHASLEMIDLVQEKLTFQLKSNYLVQTMRIFFEIFGIGSVVCISYEALCNWLRILNDILHLKLLPFG